MFFNNRKKGAEGELIAQNYLKKLGYKIIDTNWHYSKFCELDIVAKEKDVLVFTEVKYRTDTSCGSPLEAVNSAKLNNIKTAILAYLQKTKEKFKSYRFDVIGIVGKENPQIEHLKNVEFY